MSGILHESWLGKIVADHVRKLNAFGKRYLA